MYRRVYFLYLLTLVEAATSTNMHCLPGQEARKNETTGETYCVDCGPRMFSKNGRKCYLCSVCHQGQTEIKSCSKNRNTVCRCPRGTYLKGGAICKTCSHCPKGMIQTLDCAHNMDRSCRKCPDGLTTNSTNGRVCIAIKVKPNTPNIIIRHIVDWWIFLFIPAFVVLLGICAAIYYWRFRKKKNSNKPKIVKRDIYELEENCPEQVLFPPEEARNCRMVRELPAHLYEELGLKLNNHHPRNWIYLAGMLGFNRDQIRYLELEPRESTQNLINDWSSKSGSTVYNLHVALLNMNRADAARVIEGYIYR